MPKKYRRIRRRENLVVFPGTFEKLVEKGNRYVDTGLFEEAVEAFDQAIVYEPDDPEFLGPYAVALYETKDFIRAKDIAARLLQSGAVDYVNAMELYLTISIQLQEYDEVEMTIETLLEEQLIPEELMAKFNYLRELNNRLAKRYPDQYGQMEEIPFTFNEFIKMDISAQQHALASLEGTDLSVMIPVLIDIAEGINHSPLVITFALTLLREANCKDELTIQKLGLVTDIVPANIHLPGRDEQTENVLVELERLLLQDPSRFELAKSLVEKFAITAFPFDWGGYAHEEIAQSYVEYIACLFTGEKVPETELVSLIQRMDLETNIESI